MQQQTHLPTPLPPGTHPDGTPMFFELDYQDRETLLVEYARNWADINKDCESKGDDEIIVFPAGIPASARRCQ